MAAASTIKLLALAGVLERAQAEGRSLTDDERSYLEPMIALSDNDAATEAMDDLERSGGSIGELGASWGVPGARHPSWGTSPVTAREMAGLVAAMFDGTRLGPEARVEALRILDLVDKDFATGWRVAVGFGLPAGWDQVSKVGVLVTDDAGLHVHGVGLVWGPDGQRYAVAVLAHGWEGYEDEPTAVAELGGHLSSLLTAGG
jgi:hypothetical protein